jgi:hypothetical protein
MVEVETATLRILRQIEHTQAEHTDRLDAMIQELGSLRMEIRTLSGREPEKINHVMSLIHTIARGRGPALVAASPALRLRLVEASEAITDRMTRADTLSIIARTLPN